MLDKLGIVADMPLGDQSGALWGELWLLGNYPKGGPVEVIGRLQGWILQQSTIVRCTFVVLYSSWLRNFQPAWRRLL